ncbi:MAG: methyl-accepting chemotaxis protein [Marinisporobacter sp.]|jgi:methyl-accepting chemotaxis protein|nr:methyl-accepting chemotaxis protein [Marinisporobacter sp.]
MKNKNQIRFGIGAKLSIVFILLITIPLLTLGMISYGKSVAIMEENLKDSSLRLVKEIKKSINNKMDGFEESAIQMSYEANVQQASVREESVQWMMKNFKSFIKAHPETGYIYLATKNKDMYIYPEAELPQGYDPTQRGWYKEAVNKNGVVWTNPYVDAVTGKTIITVAIPVYNGFNNNEFTGVLAADISLETLAKHINSIKIGNKGYAAILDRNLNTMIHKNKELIGKPLPIKGIETAIKEKVEGYVDYEWEENGEKKKKVSVFSKIDKLGWTVLGLVYVDEIEKDVEALKQSALIIGGITLLIAIGISYVFAKNLTKHIKVLLVDMEKIKQGDLTVISKVQAKDEIGRLGENFNSMIDEISKLVRNVQNASKQVTSSAENLAATSEETSASSEEVSRTVEEIARGATEQAGDAERGAMLTAKLSDKFNELNNSTGDMMTSAKAVMGANSEGVKAVKDLKDRTNINTKATEKIENAIMELDNKTKYIGGILDTIASIAEQTNLLALNASIEAARAGEHGKGFAVVAEEIRKLAEGSREAADEIKEIVVNIQSDSSNTVQIMKDVKERSQEQYEAVEKVTGSFDTISESIEGMVQKIELISSFVRGLNTDKDAIVGAIENISAVSEETAAASEEVSASMHQQSMAVEEVARIAENLNYLASNLNEEISRFKI